MRKRILSLLLVACLVLPMIPVMALTALATEGDGTYSTNFSADPTNPNFPTLNLSAATEETTHNIGETYSYDNVDKNAYLPNLVTLNGNWEVGAFPVEWNSTTGAVTVKEGFSPYRVIRRDGENDLSINDGFGTWGSHSDGRGGALFMDSHLEWVLSFGMNYGGADDRYVKNYYSTSGIRYTAEYTGVIDITVAAAFFAANGTDIAILHNGTVVATIENDGTAVKGNDGSNVDFGEVVSDLAVATGDTIAFVNIGDSSYNQDVEGFDYGNTKRGFRNFDITITYAEGYVYEAPEVVDTSNFWNNTDSANIVHTITDAKDAKLYFFTWFTADGTRVAVEQTDILNEECYAVVNPYLLENGIVAADDTYAAAMEKYRAYLKTLSYIEYTGNWSYGVNIKGEYEPILFPSYLDQLNAYAIRANSAGKSVVQSCGSSRWVSEYAFDKMFDSFYETSWQGTVTNNTTIPQRDSLVKDIRVSFTTDLNKSGSQGNGMAQAPTSVASVGGVESECYADIVKALYLRPYNNQTNISNLSAAAFGYTVPEKGVLNLTVNSVAFLSSNRQSTENLDTTWALFVNNVQKTDFATVDNKNGNNPADAINATLAEVGAIVVNEGDVVQFVVVRGPSGGTHVAMDITAELDTSLVSVTYKAGGEVLMSAALASGSALPALENAPEGFGANGYLINGVFATELPATVTEDLVIEDFYIPSSVSLTIAGNFAINVYVAGGDDVTAAGVLVNGEEFAGVLQEDGTYKVTVATIAAKNLLKTEVTYKAYQYVGETRSESNAATTVTAVDLLNAYKATNMPVATQNLAQAVINYAKMADIFLNNGALESNDPVKTELKGQNTIAGNYDSGAYDVLLATIKMYSVAGYTPEYHPDRYPDASHTFVPDATVTEADKVVWGFGEQNPTDAAFKFAINGITLNLEDTIGFALRIQANGETAIKELKAENKYKVKVTMGEDVAYYDTFFYVDETLTEKALVVEGISAAACSDDYTFTVVQETEDGYVDVSATLTYSVNAWCVNQFNFAETTTFAYLVRAIYRLGLAADAYAAL